MCVCVRERVCVYGMRACVGVGRDVEVGVERERRRERKARGLLLCGGHYCIDGYSIRQMCVTVLILTVYENQWNKRDDNSFRTCVCVCVCVCV